MAVWPNNRFGGVGSSPGRHFGIYSEWSRYCLDAQRLNRFANPNQQRTASTPDGYDVLGTVPAIKAGAMSSWRPTSITVGSNSNLLRGLTLSGTAGATLSGDNLTLALIVGLDGTGAVASFSGDGAVLGAALALAGSGTLASIDGAVAVLSVWQPISGTFASEFVPDADLRGKLIMSGSWSPFEELSPQSLAAAVWNAAMAEHIAAGSTGQALNAAGAAGDPWITTLPGGYIEQQAGAVIAEIKRMAGLIPATL